MAGIGFELKKLFSKKGVYHSVKAFGYAAAVCTGPMLLGVILILGIMLLCRLAACPRATRELLICMITYTLLASLSISSFFSMLVTRYTADMLYEEKREAILPSFWGSNVIMMSVGSLLWFVFLIFSGAGLGRAILLFVLFNELILVWNSMNYLSAIKDYKGIFLSFLSAILASFILGYILICLHLPILESLLFSVSVGYGIMLVWDSCLLHRYFPKSDSSPFDFLSWADEFMKLALCGFFSNIGMFAHIVILWFSDIGVRVHGLFFGAPQYDIAALLAFMTTLITTVNFVVSVEVSFYPKYRTHYSLYNDKGTISDIKQAEGEMLDTLRSEIFYTALKQLLCSVLFVAGGGYILDVLPLGFNELMRGYFRTLCIGYGVYAIANMIMLMLLYFTDYKGALIATAAFAAGSVCLSLISLIFSNIYYGFAFFVAAFIYLAIATARLDYFTKRLPYYILSVQPLVSEDKPGFCTRMGRTAEKILQRSWFVK